jgi:hypothetical protein
MADRDSPARFFLRNARVETRPFQMAAVAQRLAKKGLPIGEYPMTVPNLTAATSNLFDLITARQLLLYPDADMRLAISRAVIVESARGWRLDKLKQAHKIDMVVALSLAALAAVRTGGRLAYDLDMSWISGPDDGTPPHAITIAEKAEWSRAQLCPHIIADARRSRSY